MSEQAVDRRDLIEQPPRARPTMGEPGTWAPAYERFVAGLYESKAGKRGRGSSLDGLEKAPTAMGELPEYFAGLPAQRLAGCWVSSVVTATMGRAFSPGDIARCLIVVAQRLHGITFEIAQGEPVNINPPRPQAAPAPSSPAQPAPPQGKYAVFGGTPPAEKAARARTNEAMGAAMVLQPGHWFIYEDAPKTFNCKVNTEKWSKAAGFPLLLYKSSAGKVIVRRPENTAKPSEGTRP